MGSAMSIIPREIPHSPPTIREMIQRIPPTAPAASETLTASSNPPVRYRIPLRYKWNIRPNISCRIAAPHNAAEYATQFILPSANS